MIKAKWTIRLGVLGALLSVAIVAIAACRDAKKSGPTPTTAAVATDAAPAVSR